MFCGFHLQANVGECSQMAILHKSMKSFETIITTELRIHFGVCSSSTVHAHKNKIKPFTNLNLS